MHTLCSCFLVRTKMPSTALDGRGGGCREGGREGGGGRGLEELLERPPDGLEEAF